MDEKEIKNNSARSDIKSIHTYTSDMADAIRENEASVIKIALAEKEKRERETIYKEAEGTKSSKFFLLLGGVILVGGAILGSYFLFKKSTVAPETKTTVKDIDTLISFDQKAFIDATDARIQTDLYALIKDELTKEAPLLSVKALILTEDLGDGKRLLPVENLLSVLGDRAPQALMRTIDKDYMLGSYNDSHGKEHVFLILKVKDYNQAYASMLEWEKTLLEDMFTLFNKDLGSEGLILFEKPWKDIIINNRDARIIYDREGNDLLYYIFTDKNTLDITDSQDTVKEVSLRLLAKSTKPL
jgi:hypothetical protein